MSAEEITKGNALRATGSLQAQLAAIHEGLHAIAGQMGEIFRANEITNRVKSSARIDNAMAHLLRASVEMSRAMRVLEEK